MSHKSQVLFVSAEIAPIAKVGGLADVVGSLPQALQKLGTEAVVAMPFYAFLKPNKQLKAKKILSIDVKFNNNSEKVDIFQGCLPGSDIILYLYDRCSATADSIYSSAKMSGQLYVNPYIDLERFAFFSLAVVESLEKLPIKFPVVHCHDWHTGLIPYLLRASDVKTLFTIHNLANQGQIDTLLEAWLGDKASGLPKVNDQYNLMALGLKFAQQINTVSPNYAQEILTKEYGCGLERIIKQEQKKLSGIVNGIDVEMFNPATDKHIPFTYDSANLGKKIKNKLFLQKQTGLTINQDLPLIGLVSRFVGQKGLDLVTEKIIGLPAQFVFLGEGDPVIEANLIAMAAKFPNIKVIKGFDLKLAQLIYAGADFFLMPSRFEPCGLGQLIAMRYGTLPIVCLVGGLKDTVTDKTGYGFFQKTDKVLYKTINEALTEFYAQPKRFEAKKSRAMKGDYSWSKSAIKYQKIYNKLANIK